MELVLSEDTKAKVLRQVEFYFSESNLPRDIFLRGQVDSHPDGYVDLSLIISFSRMRALLKLGEVEADAIEDATVLAVGQLLRASELLLVSATGFQVKRRDPLPPEGTIRRIVDSRSIYARPLPYNASLDEITEFFSKVGTVRCVRMRRHLKSKDFKGSVFVEMSAPEEASAVLAMSLVYAGAPLRMLPKMKYMQVKIAMRKQKQMQGDLTLAALEEEESELDVPMLQEVNEAAAERAERLGLKRKAVGEAEEAGDEAAGGEAGGSDGKGAEAAGTSGDGGVAGAENGEAGAAGGGDAAGAAAAVRYDPGCILQVMWEGEAPEAARGESAVNLLRSAFGGSSGGVRFAEKPRPGSNVAYVRFFTADKATAAAAEYEARPEAEQVVCEARAALSLLEGDGEREYYVRAEKSRAASQQRQQGGGGGGRWGGGGWRGRGGDSGGWRGRGRGGGRDGGGRGRGRGGDSAKRGRHT